ncbi:TorF family putative porin [Roseateles amylovorans]|uniref:TorF family putative porin n=1 Tax=Roseateles amylovorans TaxID=2978473 RepID=A0ABY6BA95_9BURK|nr:TorF family putative porin [Roseateles amylovorans]UXH80495.1 TorF family putative porin [Roseateles amylovorans]
MKTRLLTLFLMSACLLQATARADESAPMGSAAAAPNETPALSLTGNLGFVSDYRFRGISQTWKRPAVQAGLDLVHRSGFYLGAWGSNVSGNSYNNGAGMELDLYGGFKTPIADGVTLDLGALAYVYPGARLNRAPGQPSDDKYDNLDLYAAVSAGAFSAKLSVAATDYFGLNSTTSGYAYFSALPAKGASKGTAYLDLNYGVDLGQGVSAGLHVGHLWVRRYGDLSYTDWKLGLSKAFDHLGGLTVSAALVGTDADNAFYQAGDAGGLRAKRLGDTGLVLGIARTF